MKTADLSKFTREELHTAGVLLLHYARNNVTERVRDHFVNDDVHIECDTKSQFVYITNSDEQILRLNNDMFIDLYLCTPTMLIEGFFDDLVDNYNELSIDDKKYLELYDTYKVIDDIRDDD